MSFHINGQGNPGPCTAQAGNCPFGDGDVHFSSAEDAVRAYEEEMALETVPVRRTLGANLTRQEAIELDQFFTKDSIAYECMEELADKLSVLGYDASTVEFVEPSAGGGSFVRAAQAAFPGRPVSPGDLAPKDPSIHALDFVNDDVSVLMEGSSRENRVVIGNPPFGYKARLAKDFVNRAFEHADTVVFVVPIQFQKYGTQNDIVTDAKLVHDERLPFDAFTVNGSSYGVQCCFQIWTRRDTGMEDLRKRTRPLATHPDFDTWVVSSKPESKRHIEEADWDYAVVTQGFKGNFEVIPRAEAERLSPKRQYLLMKGKTPEATARLTSMDFEKLAGNNSTKILGFGKADLVEAYSQA